MAGSYGYVGRNGGSGLKAWTRVTAAAPTNQTLRGVWGTGATDIFVAGFGGVILHYKD